MLPKAKRLVRSDFARRPARTLPFAFGSVKIFPGEPKAAVVISKKVCSTATGRNLLRRRIYAIVRPFILEGRAKGQVIVFPNRAAVSVPFAELKSALVIVLARC